MGGVGRHQASPSPRPAPPLGDPPGPVFLECSRAHVYVFYKVVVTWGQGPPWDLILM